MASAAAHPDFKVWLDEMRQDCIAGPYPQLLRTFDPVWGSDAASYILQAITGAYCANPWHILRMPPSADDIPAWLSAAAMVTLPGQNGYWKSALPVKASKDWMTGVNMVMASKRGPGKEWKNINAVCHGADANETYQVALVHLYGLASKAFYEAPLRRFIRGVLFHGEGVEFWIFDRCGMYSSDVMNLATDHRTVLFALQNLCLMTQDDLGCQNILKEDDESGALQLTLGEHRYHLQHEPFVNRDDTFSDA